MPFFNRDADDYPRRVATRTTHPSKCRCGQPDYSRIDEGVIECPDCGRQWRLRGKGWWPYPCPGCGLNPEVCRHYGKRPWTPKGTD